MGTFVSRQTILAIFAASIALPFCVLGSRAASNPEAGGADRLLPITVDYPTNDTLFPPDIIPPLFQWRDDTEGASTWRIQISFVGRGPKIDVWSSGEKMRVGELDTSLVGYVPPELTPEQQAAHTWRPDPKVWETDQKAFEERASDGDDQRLSRIQNGRTNFSRTTHDSHVVRSGGRAHSLPRRAPASPCSRGQ